MPSPCFRFNFRDEALLISSPYCRSLMYSNFLGLFRKNRHLERVYLRLAHRQCQISGMFLEPEGY